MAEASLSFVDGLRCALMAMVRLLQKKSLRQWYLKALLKTLLLSLGIFLVLAGTGYYFLSVWIQDFLTSALAIMLWTLALFYISGTLSLVLMNSFVGVLSGQNQLQKILYPTYVPSSRGLWKERKKEAWAVVRSAGISLMAWPLFIFLFTIPIGVIIFAWALGAEALASAEKGLAEIGTKVPESAKSPTPGFAIGIGFVPAALSLFPVVGWMFLPLLLLTAYQAAGVALPRSAPDRDAIPV